MKPINKKIQSNSFKTIIKNIYKNIDTDINDTINFEKKLNKKNKVWRIISTIFSLLIIGLILYQFSWLVDVSTMSTMNWLNLYFMPISYIITFTILSLLAPDPFYFGRKKVVQSKDEILLNWINFAEYSIIFIFVNLIIIIIGAKTKYIVQFICYFSIFNFITILIQQLKHLDYIPIFTKKMRKIKNINGQRFENFHNDLSLPELKIYNVILSKFITFSKKDLSKNNKNKSEKIKLWITIFKLYFETKNWKEYLRELSKLIGYSSKIENSLIQFFDSIL